MKDWVVYYLIHVRTPYRHIAQLFINAVPGEITAREIKSLLTQAGYRFGEFGVAWANHVVEPLDENSPDEVIGAYQDDEWIDRTTFSRLQEAAGVRA